LLKNKIISKYIKNIYSHNIGWLLGDGFNVSFHFFEKNKNNPKVDLTIINNKTLRIIQSFFQTTTKVIIDHSNQ